MRKAKFFVYVKGANGATIAVNPHNILHIERDDEGGRINIGKSRIYFAGFAIRVQGDPTEVALKIEEQMEEIFMGYSTQ